MFIIILFWLGSDRPSRFFFRVRFLYVLSPLLLPSSSVSLSYFILAVSFRECFCLCQFVPDTFLTCYFCFELMLSNNREACGVVAFTVNISATRCRCMSVHCHHLLLIRITIFFSRVICSILRVNLSTDFLRWLHHMLNYLIHECIYSYSIPCWVKYRAQGARIRSCFFAWQETSGRPQAKLELL